jgi:CRISPR/Cas system-associated exonuclease Cas4 (RecB family)
MLKSDQNKVPLEHLDDYSKCTNYAKYNWSNIKRKRHYLFSSLKDLILDTYIDQANLNRKIVWKTLRNKVHNKLVPVILGNKSISDYLKIVKRIMEQLRSWYINHYRDGPDICLASLQIESKVPSTGLSIEANIDAVLLSNQDIFMVEITDKYKNINEAISSVSLRAKVWLLAQQGVKVNKITLILIHEGNVLTENITIHNIDEYLFKTEKVLQWCIGGIKHNITFPSVTPMCKSCLYKDICTW